MSITVFDKDGNLIKSLPTPVVDEEGLPTLVVDEEGNPLESESRSSTTKIVIAVVFGVLSVVLLIGAVLLWKRRTASERKDVSDESNAKPMATATNANGYNKKHIVVDDVSANETGEECSDAEYDFEPNFSAQPTADFELPPKAGAKNADSDYVFNVIGVHSENLDQEDTQSI